MASVPSPGPLTSRQKVHQKRTAGLEKIKAFEAARKLKEAEKKKSIESRLKVADDKLGEGEEIVSKISKVFKEVKSFQAQAAKFYNNLQMKETEEKSGHSNGSPIMASYWHRVGGGFENSEKMLGNTCARLKELKGQIQELRKEISSQKSKILKQFSEQSSKLEKSFSHFDKVASSYNATAPVGSQAEDIYLVGLEYHETLGKTQEVHLTCYQSVLTLFEKAGKLNEQRVVTLRSIFEEYTSLQNKHYSDLVQVGEQIAQQVRSPSTVQTDNKKQQQQQPQDQFDSNKEREIFDPQQNLIEFPFQKEKKQEGELSREGGKIMKSFSKKKVVLTKSGFLHTFDADEKDKEAKSFNIHHFNIEKGKDSTIVFVHADPKVKDKHVFKAASDAEADKWIEQFQKRKAKLLEQNK